MEVATTLRGIRARQLRLSLLLACAFGGTCVLVDGISRSSTVLSWIQNQQVSHWRARNTYYQHTLTFWEIGSRILLDEIPNADFSRGGVCFIGSSALRAFVMAWKLPEPLRSLVHNFAIGAATQVDQLHLVEYLVQYEGLAAAGDKTMVVLGLFYGNAVDAENWKFASTFPAFVTKDGVYTYDRQSGMHPAQIPFWLRWLRREFARCANFLKVCGEYLEFADGSLRLRPRFEERGPHNRESYKRMWRGLMMGHIEKWKPPMIRQTAALQQLIVMLQKRRVAVTAVLLPLGSWHRELPYPSVYRDLVSDLCARTGVALVDLTDLLADDEFYDHTHPNYRGTRRLDPVLMEIARAHLTTAGLLEDTRTKR